MKVVIAGGSFAGLAVAMGLGGRNAVLVEPHPIGEHTKSANAMPFPVAVRFGGRASILEVHPELVLHVGGRVFRQPMDPPYVTVDYRRFCTHMLEAAGVEVIQAHALAARPEGVSTTRGEIEAGIVVDATGPMAALAASLHPGYAERGHAGVGLEVEVPRPAGLSPGLHFYVEDALPPGYGWAFGAGDRARIGVYLYQRRNWRVREVLEGFLTALALPGGARHGGLIPWRLRPPVIGSVFVVGDAAGQVMPTTAEGIRPALYFGYFLGQRLREVVEGRADLEEAKRHYQAEVWRRRLAWRGLEVLQRFVSVVPASLDAALLAGGRRLGFGDRMFQRYVRAMGGSS